MQEQVFLIVEIMLFSLKMYVFKGWRMQDLRIRIQLNFKLDLMFSEAT